MTCDLQRHARRLGISLVAGLLALTGPAQAQTTTSYVYDALGRLVSAIDNTGPGVLYAYDPAGNRIRLGSTGSFTNLVPSGYSTSTTQSGFTGLTASGMSDSVLSGPSTIHVTQSEAQAWIRVDFASSQYVHHVRLAPATDSGLGVGASNTNGADLEYSNDGGVTWARVTTISTAAAGVFTNLVVRANATSIRVKRTSTGRLALGSIGVFSAPGGGNGAPTERLVALDDTGITVAASGSVVIDPLQNDSHADRLPFAISSVGTPLHGTATKNVAGNRITYTPTTAYSGPDVFEYVIVDGAGIQAFAKVVILVGAGPANGAPQPVADTASAVAGVALSIPVAANDTDPNSDPLTVTAVTSPSHGTASVNSANNTVTYTAVSGYSGADAFNYTVSDGRGLTASAAVSVTVSLPGNLPPVAVNDVGVAVAGVATTISPLTNDTDPNGHSLTITAVGTPSHGTASVNSGNATITYTGSAGYSGPDSFTYAIADGHGGSDVGTISVTVNATVNTAPTAVNDAVSTPAGAAVTFNPRGNDSDPNGDSLVISAVTPPAHGAAVVNSGATITYTPTAGYSGADSFTYTISDGRGGSATATVSVTVATTAPGFYQPVFRVLKSGLTGASVGASSFDMPASSGKSALMSTPPATSFSYEIAVVAAATDSGFVGVANQAWFDAGGSFGTTTAGTAQWYVGESFSYGEASGATASWISSGQTLSAGDILGVTYSASTRKMRIYRNGVLIGTVTASASAGGQMYPMLSSWVGRVAGAFRATPSSHHSAYVIDGAANGAPVAANDNIVTSKATAVTFNPRTNDSDPDGDAVTISGVGAPSNGTAAATSGATITYTPNSSFTGVDSFTYSISDGRGGTASATVQVTVSAPPAANEFMPLTTLTSGEWWDADTGMAFSETSVNDYQGYRTLFLSKSPQTAFYAAGMTNAGSVGLTGADPGDWKWTVSTGERIGAAFEAKSLGVTTQIRVHFAYWDASWNNAGASTPTSFSVSSSAWTRAEVIANAPANARYMAVIVEMYAAGDLRAVGPHGIGLRKPQLSRLATGQAMPASTEAAFANGGPVAVNDTGSAVGGQALTITPLTNDSDPNGDPLTITAVTTPAHGTATINSGSKAITYTPAGGYGGGDSFTYTISDGRGGAATATITLNVVLPPANTAPDAINDVVTAIAGVATPLSVMVNDTDANSDPLTITGVTTPAHGSATIGAGGGLVVYTPTGGYAGADSFNYTISDGRGGSDSATVSATVSVPLPSNEFSPWNTNQADEYWHADTNLAYSKSLVSDYQGYPALVMSKTIAGAYYDGTQTLAGSFGLTAANPPGNMKWAVVDNERVGAAFDLRSLGISTHVRVFYQYWNSGWGNAGQSTATNHTISAGGWTRVEHIANAPAGARWVAVIFEVFATGDKRNTGPHGVAVRRPQFSRLATGQPMPASADATPLANSNPTAVTDTISVTTGGVEFIKPQANDSDANSDWLTLTAVGTPAHGVATIDASQTSITYVPTIGYTGSDSFSYTITDGRGGTSSALINATIATPPPFTDNFNRANQNLAGTGGWELIGSYGNILIGGNRIDTTWSGAGSGALSPDLGTYNHYVQGVVGSWKYEPASFLAARVTDVNNFVGLRYSQPSGLPRLEVFTRIGGTYTKVAESLGSWPDTTPMRLIVVGNTIQVKINGVSVLGPTTIAMPPPSTRTGIVTYQSVTTFLTDDYEAGAVN